MHKHIGKRRKCTFIINSFMRVKTFVLNAHKGVSDMLRNLLNIYRYTLNFTGYCIKLNQLIAVLSINDCICTIFQFFNGNVRRFIHKFKHIYGHCSSDNSSGYNDYQKNRQQSSSQNCCNFLCYFYLRIFRLFSNCMPCILRRSSPDVIGSRTFFFKLFVLGVGSSSMG